MSTASPSRPLRVQGFLSAYLELTKPRVTTLVLLTTAAGFYLGAPSPFPWLAFLQTLIGTGFLAGGTAVLNQYMERRFDANMRRTATRPLPTGRLLPGEAIVFGIFLVGYGTIHLLVSVNGLTALLGGLTSAIYLLLYTPLKRRTPLCTAVGAVPGAIPPLMGWTGATGQLSWEAWTLFGILFLWQYPHFLSIFLLYKDDYEKGGFKMLPTPDPDGIKAARQVLISTVLLCGISLLPSFAGWTGLIYGSGAALLGAFFLWSGFQLAQHRTRDEARRLLRVSVVYLPLLLMLMVATKP